VQNPPAGNTGDQFTVKGHVVHTLTLENGKEFAGHERIALKSRCQVYFADPCASCQRRTNGLLRQYFPKGSDFSALTVESVNRIVAKINLRPRKRLGWKTPYEVYAGVSVALMGCIQVLINQLRL
jgi:IS30 family transposase